MAVTPETAEPTNEQICRLMLLDAVIAYDVSSENYYAGRIENDGVRWIDSGGGLGYKFQSFADAYKALTISLPDDAKWRDNTNYPARTLTYFKLTWPTQQRKWVNI